jgi:hypothetical protein
MSAAVAAFAGSGHDNPLRKIVQLRRQGWRTVQSRQRYLGGLRTQSLGRDDAAQPHRAISDHGHAPAAPYPCRDGSVVPRPHDVGQGKQRRHQYIVLPNRERVQRPVRLRHSQRDRERLFAHPHWVPLPQIVFCVRRASPTRRPPRSMEVYASLLDEGVYFCSIVRGCSDFIETLCAFP